MELRPELMPPELDEPRVVRLTGFSQEIDGGTLDETRNQLAAFNREAKTDFEFIDFQGIYGGQDHDTWVRQVLGTPHEVHVANITQAELVEMARRVMKCEGPEHAIYFWLSMLKINIPNERISDLIFWPGEYFGDEYDEGNSQELSPEQVIDIALRHTVASP